MGFNLGKQRLPRNHLLHLRQEDFTTGLLAFSRALGAVACQLYGWIFNMCRHCRSGSRWVACTTGGAEHS